MSRVRRYLPPMLLGLLVLACTGCLQGREIVTVNPDGTGKFTVDVTFRPRVLAGVAQVMGRANEDLGAMIPSGREALVALVASSAGVDVWSEARAETTASGDTRLVLSGYFKSFTRLRPPNPLVLAQSLSRADSMPQAMALGDPLLERDRQGRLVLGYREEHVARKSTPVAPPPLTDEERRKLEGGRTLFTMITNMMAPLLQDAWVSRELVVPGTIADEGLFTRTQDDHATLRVDLAKLFTVTNRLVAENESIARRMFVDRESGGSVLPAGTPTDFDSVFAEALWGKHGDARVLVRDPKPRFDYALERDRAAAAAPAELRALVEEARVTRDRGGQPSRVERPDFNFALDVPPGWISSPAIASFPLARFGYQKGPLFMVTVAESTGYDLTLDAFQAFVTNAMDQRGKVKTRSSERITLGDLTFAHVMSTVVTPGLQGDFYFEHWLATRGGFAWQIIVWSERVRREAVEKAARELAEGFRLLDRDRSALQAPDVDRPEWGYRVRGAGSGWSQAGPDGDRSALIDLSWTRASEAVCVVPIRLEGGLPDMPAITRGLLSTLGLVEKDDARLQRAPWQNPIGEGIEATTESTHGGTRYAYRLRVARGKRSAFLLAGWYERGAGDSARVLAALDAITLREPDAPSPALSPEQRHALAVVLNEAGVSYFLRKSFLEAARWHRQAYEIADGDPVALLNTGSALRQGGDTAQAYAYVSTRIARFPNDADLHALLAQLELDRGDADRASRSFLAAVGFGLEDEDELYAWMQRLLGADRSALAAAACSAWVAKRPSVQVRRWHAEVLSVRGDTTRAIGMLEALAREEPSDPAVARSLADMYNGTGAYARAAEVAERALASRPDEAELLLVLGWSQMGRGWYREAKATFEHAARVDDGPRPRDALRLASGMLGQGDNSELKTRIVPVPVPREVTAAESRPLPPKFGDGYPAVYALLADGDAYEAGKPARHTTRMAVRVLTQAGADAFSTLEFPFHPAAERIFVERIEVKDAAGKVLSTSSVENAYVIDRPNDVAGGEKLLHAVIRGVKPGCTVEAEISRESRSADADPDFTRWLFAGNLPAAVRAVWVAGDTARVRSSLRHGEGLERFARAGLTGWVARALAAERGEPWSTRIEDRAPILCLGAPGASWKAVGLDYLHDLADLLKPDPAIHALALEQAGAGGERDKVARLARWVQQQIHYQAIEFGRRARRPDEASRVIAQRFGDCKDTALLLHLLLREAGIASQLALVNTEWRIELGTPSLDQFDHMVVCVPAMGEGWMVDATDKGLQLDAFPARGLEHSAILVLDPAEPRLLPAVDRLPERGQDVRSRRELRIDGADWVVGETLAFEGYAAAGVRRWLASMSPVERVQAVQQFLDPTGAVQVSSLEVENVEEPRDPAVIRLAYVVRNAVSATGDRASAAVPTFVEQRYLAMPFVNDRANPFELIPMHVASEVVVHLPARPRGSVAAPQRGSDGYCAWTLTLGRAAQPTDLDLQLDFRAVPGIHPSARYRDAVESWRAPLASIAPRLEW